MVEKKDPVEQALELAKPLAAQMSFGAVMGYCSGYAMKKVGKAVAFGVGIIFIGLQAAVSTGYISVDWAKIQSDTMKKMDTVSLIWFRILSAPCWYSIALVVNVAKNCYAWHISCSRNIVILLAYRLSLLQFLSPSRLATERSTLRMLKCTGRSSRLYW